LKRSANGRFEVRRLNRPLDSHEIDSLRSKARSDHGRLYCLGFNLDSRKLFCSKHVFRAYQEIGIEVGRVQSFRELLEVNPTSSCLNFWRVWFFGFIPWNRKTVTPASQLDDPNFFTVVEA
jgi:hypothetical protein